MSQEELFIDELENHAVVTTKGNTKELKAARKRAWKEISDAFLEKKGIIITEAQLAKKLVNFKSKVFEKVRGNSGTGGGPTNVLSSIENRLLDLYGNDNPNVAKVPGACSNLAATCTTESGDNGPTWQLDELQASTVTESAARSNKGSQLTEEIHQLQLECLQLERKKIEEHRQWIQEDRLRIEEERRLIQLKTEYYSKLNESVTLSNGCTYRQL